MRGQIFAVSGHRDIVAVFYPWQLTVYDLEGRQSYRACWGRVDGELGNCKSSRPFLVAIAQCPQHLLDVTIGALRLTNLLVPIWSSELVLNLELLRYMRPDFGDEYWIAVGA